MKVLFIGDIYSSCGRRAVHDNLKDLISEHNIDFVIANGENVTHGKSLDENHYTELSDLGIDAFTMGNHTYYGGKLEKYLGRVDNVLVPANYCAGNEGKGSHVFNCKGKTIRVTSILGKVFMMPIPENPFAALEAIVEEDEADIHIVDFHAEATSEAYCFAHAFDGKVTAMLGTHTHVMTADNRILPKGTAAITDVGMTGVLHSAIGAELAPVIGKMRTNKPLRFNVAEGKYVFCAVLIDIDDATNKAISMDRIRIEEK